MLTNINLFYLNIVYPNTTHCPAHHENSEITEEFEWNLDVEWSRDPLKTPSRDIHKRLIVGTFSEIHCFWSQSDLIELLTNDIFNYQQVLWC